MRGRSLLRRLLVGGALSTILLAASACAPMPAPAEDPAQDARPLSSDEAESLAMMRFRNFDAGVRSIEFGVADAGEDYTVSGWVDYAAHLGYATIDARGERSLIAWSADAISSHPSADQTPPLPPPGLDAGASEWTTSDLVADASRLHAALGVVLSLTSDRPDNPLLLQQTDARWLREDTIGDVAVDVIAGPTSDTPYDPGSGAADDGSDAVLRYWIDESGLLHRAEVRLGGSGEWTAVEFGEAPDVAFADAFLGAAR